MLSAQKGAVETIFALSSGSPPAAIAVVRISGPQASLALETLAGRVPAPRRASVAKLRDSERSLLDQAMIVWFPGPNTATGEDLAELHLHGGRAVVAGVEGALSAVPGLRRAQPGEFTRRAFAHGRIDLAEAEGLADLLSAETELQRRSALAMAGGAFSHVVESWRERLLSLSAQVEAVLDFEDDDDVGELPPSFARDLRDLQDEITRRLAAPYAETLREGFRVALAGPPNSGKSTLFNALVESEAAITAPIAGTTRDVLVRNVAMGGVPFSFVDMAGLRAEGSDEVEDIGIERARREVERADLVLWLGPEGEGPPDAWEIQPQCDRSASPTKSSPRFIISAVSGRGLGELKQALVEFARENLPGPGEAALNRRQRTLLAEAEYSLRTAERERDQLLAAEHLRRVRAAFDALVGRTSTEDVLDALFGRFCIGK